MEQQIFIQLAVILFTAFIISFIARIFKQPIVIGYILAGIIISPFIINLGASKEIINIFSELGIAFLLFIVGLHLNPKIIKEIGTASLFIGLAQMALTFVLGFLVSFYILSFGTFTSIYVGIALMFSSTIIVMKLLSDNRQLDSLFGKISIGILIVQDVVAIIILMFVSSFSEGANFGSIAVKGLIGGGGLICILFLLGYFFLPRFTKGIAKSQELLFLFSICWCFLIASVFSYLGFSIEVGALVAGVVLSISPYSIEISSKVRPLRDFFLIIFFIILGLNIPLSNLSSIIANALILSLIVLIGKPIILMTFTALSGYTKRTNFMTGTALAQISEFSLIILALGVAKDHIPIEIFYTLTLTLLITIVLSAYMIIYQKEFYNKMHSVTSFFEKRNVKEKGEIKLKCEAILFGYNRIGFGILKSLKSIGKNYLVVDYNPDTIAALTKLKIPCLYGDTDDSDLLQQLPLDKIEIAVSTVPDFETNGLLIKEIRKVNHKAIIIVRAHQIKDAIELYRKGASYVLTPHFLGGEYVSKMISDLKTKSSGYEEEKKKHIKMLEEMTRRGHEHPEVEKN